LAHEEGHSDAPPLRRLSIVLPDGSKLKAFRQALETVLFEERTAPADIGLATSPVSADELTVLAGSTMSAPSPAAA
jgi:hypothetical protein